MYQLSFSDRCTEMIRTACNKCSYLCLYACMPFSLEYSICNEGSPVYSTQKKNPTVNLCVCPAKAADLFMSGDVCSIIHWIKRYIIHCSSFPLYTYAVLYSNPVRIMPHHVFSVLWQLRGCCPGDTLLKGIIQATSSPGCVRIALGGLTDTDRLKSRILYREHKT